MLSSRIARTSLCCSYHSRLPSHHLTGLGRPSLRLEASCIGTRRTSVHALPFDVATVPQEALIAGVVGAVALAGLVGWQVSQNNTSMDTPDVEPQIESAASPALRREDAVLVFGATGRLGRKVVQRLLRAGRTVVAAVRSGDKASQVYQPLGVTEGAQEDNGGILFVEAGIDVTQPDSVDQDRLWTGVRQVVSCLGTVTGPLPQGGFGIIDDMSPERVEGQGLATHVVSALSRRMTKAQSSVREVLSLSGSDALAVWDRLDDVIMGGNSSSALEPAADSNGAVWRGNLVMKDGGFCGVRTKRLNLDLSDCDGLEMTVRGDGQIFKFNIKTLDQEDTPESTYQTTFDTVADTWVTLRLPWHHFVPVKRAQSDPKGQPLNAAEIAKLGLVLSRFEFNKAPNPSYKEGAFELHIQGGIRAYKDPRPQIVMVSSAGVERNAIIGDDVEARKRDIPIVQLNPAGTLNWKFAAETAVRASGYPYVVVRATGMVDPPAVKEGEAATFIRLEADQGDSMSGQLTRDDVADALVAALSSPEASGKTFELRRSEAQDGKRPTGMAQSDWLRLFLKLSLDRHRWRVGLAPFPKPVPPPAPVTEERLKEILSDVARVRQNLPATKQITVAS